LSAAPEAAAIIAGLPPLRALIAAHGLSARKALGQHFLLDPNLTARIARAAGDLAIGTTIEIGPGPGGLTRALLAAPAGRLLAIETDPRCVAALAGLAAAFPAHLALAQADALKIDPITMARARAWPPPYRIVANLPYNVGTALLLRWLADAAAYESLTLMFQREVADRLAAPPGGKDYGRLSVHAQWKCEIRRLFDSSPRAFVPPPAVWSSVLRLEPRAAPKAPAREAALERVLAAAFNQRRKMLRGSLKVLGVAPEPLLEMAGIAPTARAEEIPVEGFCAMARALDAVEGAADGPSRG